MLNYPLSRLSLLKFFSIALILAMFVALPAQAQTSAQPCLKPKADQGATGLAKVIMQWVKKVHQTDVGKDFQQPQASNNLQNSTGSGGDIFQGIFSKLQGGLGSIAQMIPSSLSGMMGGSGAIGGSSASSIISPSGGGNCQSAPKVSRFDWTKSQS